MAITQITIDTIDRPKYKLGVHGEWVEYEVSGTLIWDFREAIVKHIKDMYRPTVATAMFDTMSKEFNKLMKSTARVGMQDGNLAFLDLGGIAAPERLLRFATKEELAGGRENIKWLLEGTRDLVWEPILIEDDGIEDTIPYPILDVNEPLHLHPTQIRHLAPPPNLSLNLINTKGLKIPDNAYSGFDNHELHVLLHAQMEAKSFWGDEE